MSELKARGVDDVYIEYYNTGKHELAQVYLKSEADQVIADLIEKNKRLAHKDAIMASETIKDLFKELRHHKYKRCLAMAKLAVKDDYAPWNMKWHKRWLELAEKFKEAK